MNDLAVVNQEFDRIAPGAVAGLSLRTHLLDPELSLSDFEVQFTEAATAQDKTTLRNRVSTFIGWSVEQRQDYLDSIRPATVEERVAALEALVAELEARLSALENV